MPKIEPGTARREAQMLPLCSLVIVLTVFADRIWCDFRENKIVNFNRKFEQDDFCGKRIKIESFLAKLGKIFSNFRRSQLMASSKHLRFVEINRNLPVLVAIFFIRWNAYLISDFVWVSHELIKKIIDDGAKGMLAKHVRDQGWVTWSCDKANLTLYLHFRQSFSGH